MFKRTNRRQLSTTSRARSITNNAQFIMLLRITGLDRAMNIDDTVNGNDMSGASDMAITTGMVATSRTGHEVITKPHSEVAWWRFRRNPDSIQGPGIWPTSRE